MREGWPSGVALGLFIVGALSLPIVDPQSPTLITVFSEDFESASWSPAIHVYDENLASGDDTWAITDFVSHGGRHSAAAAGSGTNSADGLPNLAQSGDIWLARYDNNMSASMDIDLRSSSQFNGRSLTFFYAAQTEPWLVDYLSVLALNGTQWTTLWTQNTTFTADFYPVNVSVPEGVGWISFHFYSDATNDTWVGAYVDDILVFGMSSGTGGGVGTDWTTWLLVGGLAAAGAVGLGVTVWLITRGGRRRG